MPTIYQKRKTDSVRQRNIKIKSTDQSLFSYKPKKKKRKMGIDIAKIKVGDKVHYQPEHYEEDRWENGMVKEVPTHTTTALRVVYNCNGDWDNFKNYTSALTDIRDLKLGWRHE